MLAALAYGCGDSAATTPPTASDLLADARTAGRVPGLDGLLSRPPISHPEGSKPVVLSGRTCVATWNSKAPHKTVRWVADRATGDAIVTFYEAPEGTIGDNSPPRAYKQCAFGIVLGPRQLVVVVAPYPGSREAWKGANLRYQHAETIRTLVKRFNASLDSGGSIRLH